MCGEKVEGKVRCRGEGETDRQKVLRKKWRVKGGGEDGGGGRGKGMKRGN